MIHLISDLHFNHEKIAFYCNRPDDWQKRVIRYCQALIKPQDTVICLGDFGWGSWHKLKEIFDLLPGEWFISPGNHDNPKHLAKIGFKYIFSKHGASATIPDSDLYKYGLTPQFFYIKDNIEGDPRGHFDPREPFGDLERPKIAISHQPFAMIPWPYFYGHIHNSPFTFSTENDYGPPLFGVEGQNVSLEVINYKPVPLPVLLYHRPWIEDNWKNYFANHFGFDKEEVEKFEKKAQQSL